MSIFQGLFLFLLLFVFEIWRGVEKSNQLMEWPVKVTALLKALFQLEAELNLNQHYQNLKFSHHAQQLCIHYQSHYFSTLPHCLKTSALVFLQISLFQILYVYFWSFCFVLFACTLCAFVLGLFHWASCVQIHTHCMVCENSIPFYNWITFHYVCYATFPVFIYLSRDICDVSNLGLGRIVLWKIV